MFHVTYLRSKLQKGRYLLFDLLGVLFFDKENFKNYDIVEHLNLFLLSKPTFHLLTCVNSFLNWDRILLTIFFI